MPRIHTIFLISAFSLFFFFCSCKKYSKIKLQFYGSMLSILIASNTFGKSKISSNIILFVAYIRKYITDLGCSSILFTIYFAFFLLRKAKHKICVCVCNLVLILVYSIGLLRICQIVQKSKDGSMLYINEQQTIIKMEMVFQFRISGK